MSQLSYLYLHLLWLLLVGCKDSDTPEVTPTESTEEAETFLGGRDHRVRGS